MAKKFVPLIIHAGKGRIVVGQIEVDTTTREAEGTIDLVCLPGTYPGQKIKFRVPALEDSASDALWDKFFS